MEDDSEIDVLGDFSLGSLLTDHIGLCDQDDGRSFDYPSDSSNWFLDGSSSVWDDQLPTEQNQCHNFINTEEITDVHGWTDKEKELLGRGMELFGKNWVNLSQYIGTKGPTQVRSYAKKRKLGLQVKDNVEPMPSDELLSSSNDNEIPCSIEEVIMTVSTAQPTVASKKFSRGKANKRPESKVLRKKSKLQEKKSAQDANQNPIQASDSECGSSKNVVLVQNDEDDSYVDVEDDVLTTALQPESSIDRKAKRGNRSKTVQFVNVRSSNSKPKGDRYTLNNEQRLEMIRSLPKPTHSKVIDPEIVLKEEEILFPEFFGAGRNRAALLQRYLKIRSHVVSLWNVQKPKYVKKSLVRQGLRTVSDVNVLNRIHAYLEQKGIINFDCEECRYNASDVEVKTIDLLSAKKFEGEDWYNPIRRRKKEDPIAGDGKNYTFAHEDNGSVRLAHISSELTRQQEKDHKIKNKAITFVHCKQFETPPYDVQLDLQCLLVADIHGHASVEREVMGLLGGRFDDDNRKLYVAACVPCFVLSSTNFHCDMCPVSQCQAKETLEALGLDVVGWYHTHPHSLPEPSPQDLTSQGQFQTHFDRSSAPFIGLILPPYTHYQPKIFVLFEEQPFELHYDVSCNVIDTEGMREQMRSALTKVAEVTPFDKEVPKKSKTYLQTCMDHFSKMLSSISALGETDSSALLTTIKDVLTYSEDVAVFDIEVLD
ncbi:Myb-like, SWIRM and MPN domains 1 [Nesidiocoris tenuis]|uniref:Myb-like, SWIRM and MPN domain-containing protein 1 n=1 Tax=Nesidiocoris tenuis TaxID=355587 RepID=A0ABN7BCY9_9HEMI|nr:Myb-like, SWIRM and MPN domains 1 [Nesidiocoris tenuis]